MVHLIAEEFSYPWVPKEIRCATLLVVLECGMISDIASEVIAKGTLENI